ncbi:MAG: DUF4434 domain-containing protein [Clostridium perfringens]|nr:DUF4434 domain-containing protein [Clostridium perfringens]
MNIKFESSFIQAWYAKDFSKERWIEEFIMLKEKNIDEIILQSVFNTFHKECFYKTNIKNFSSNSIDMIRNCLEAARETNCKVRIGLGESKLWWIYGVLNKRWILKEMELNKEFFNEIFNLYGEHSTLSGWYIPYELSDYFIVTKAQRKNINKFLKEICDNIKEKSDLSIMISPYFSIRGPRILTIKAWGKALKEALENCKIDILALQDSVGAGFNKVNNIEKLFKYTKKATDDLKITLYADTETFKKRRGKLISATEEEFLERAYIIKNYVKGHIAFSINHYQNNKK